MEINIKRVGSLIKRDWILYRRYYYLGIFLLLAVCLCITFLVSDEASPHTPPDVPEIIFGVMLFFVGSIHTLRSFREFKRQSDTVTYLLIPATHIEKFLSRWIITLPLFMVVCSGLFFIAYPIFSFIAESIFEIHFTTPAEIRWSYFLQHYTSYVFVHSVFFFFAILFNRYTVIKSIFSFIILWSIFVLFSYYINNGNVQADDSFKALLTSNYRFLMFFAVPIFWALSYSCLKSKTA